MSSASDLLELIVTVAMFIAVGAVCAAPRLLVGWVEDRRSKFEQDAIRQSEIQRKVAIAEAAIEARKRGETFVPPVDYAR